MKLIPPSLGSLRAFSRPAISNTRALFLAAALCCAAASLASGKDSQLGTWNLDEAGSTFSPGISKNKTVVYTRLPDGRLRVEATIERVKKNGEKTETQSVWIGRTDGKPYPVTGSPSYDSIAYTKEGFVAYKKGKVVMTGTINYENKGKTRIITANGLTSRKKKLESTAKYAKQ